LEAHLTKTSGRRFCYLAHILTAHSHYAQAQLWRSLAKCVLKYQRAHLQLVEKFGVTTCRPGVHAILLELAAAEQ
jgi:siderophore synthetase component